MVNEKALKKSFERIKKDIQVLAKRDEFIATEMSNLRSEFNELKDEIHDQSFVEKLANSILEKIESKLETAETIDEKVPETLETQPETTNPQPQINNPNPILNQVDSTMFLKQKIKTKILNLCSQRVRPSDLKKAIVDMSKLCSKATFYRYLSELKREGIIHTIDINNKLFLVAAEALLDRNIYK